MDRLATVLTDVYQTGMAGENGGRDVKRQEGRASGGFWNAFEAGW